jgi:hypothetical protein
MSSVTQKKFQFRNNVKHTNGPTKPLEAYIPNNEEDFSLQYYRRPTRLRSYPPIYPHAKLPQHLAQYMAEVHTKNFSTMEEMENAVRSLPVSPNDQKVILQRLQFLYGRNMNEGHRRRNERSTRKNNRRSRTNGHFKPAS